VETAIKFVVGGVILFSLLSAAIMGTVTPVWDSTHRDRLLFWIVFLPSLVILLAFAFVLGRLST